MRSTSTESVVTGIASDRQPAQLQLRHGHVLEHQHRLEDRGATDVPRRSNRLDHAIERHLLTGEGLDRNPPSDPEQRLEGSHRDPPASATPTCSRTAR